MATFARHADVDWTGNLMEGNGTAKAGTGDFLAALVICRDCEKVVALDRTRLAGAQAAE